VFVVTAGAVINPVKAPGFRMIKPKSGNIWPYTVVLAGVPADPLTILKYLLLSMNWLVVKTLLLSVKEINPELPLNDKVKEPGCRDSLYRDLATLIT
jgi:hypothetical protein